MLSPTPLEKALIAHYEKPGPKPKRVRSKRKTTVKACVRAECGARFIGVGQYCSHKCVGLARMHATLEKNRTNCLWCKKEFFKGKNRNKFCTITCARYYEWKWGTRRCLHQKAA